MAEPRSPPVLSIPRAWTGAWEERGRPRLSASFSAPMPSRRGCSFRTSAGCSAPCCCLPPSRGRCTRTTLARGFRTGRTCRGLASTRTSSPTQRAAVSRPAPSALVDVDLPTSRFNSSGTIRFPPRSVNTARHGPGPLPSYPSRVGRVLEGCKAPCARAQDTPYVEVK